MVTDVGDRRTLGAQEANELLTRLEASNESNPFFFVYQGEIALSRGEHEKAINYMVRALRQDSADACKERPPHGGAQILADRDAMHARRAPDAVVVGADIRSATDPERVVPVLRHASTLTTLAPPRQRHHDSRDDDGPAE